MKEKIAHICAVIIIGILILFAMKHFSKSEKTLNAIQIKQSEYQAKYDSLMNNYKVLK